MLIRIPAGGDCHESEVTPEAIYRSRRRFVQGAALAGAAVGVPLLARAAEQYPGVPASPAPPWFVGKLGDARWRAVVAQGEAITPYADATQYNNFYEFGTGKGDPAANAGKLQVEPWTVMVDGEVSKPGRYSIEDLVKPHAFEERIYRLRCVEAWSMVIPWLGFPLADLLKQVEPTSSARYVRFETLVDRERMPGQRSGFSLIDWPYVEGLRLDEAMHPLTLFATGVYGKPLPQQNGAPLRLVVPWKYGFKSIKSIVEIRFVERMPATAWNQLQPSEYGFFSNVNPAVDHPRWSQATERRLGELFKRKTLPYNGYPEVASLYAGMNTKRLF